MRYFASSLSILGCFLLLAVTAMAEREVDHITKTFPAKRLVRLETSMGSCVVKVGVKDQITVDLDYTVEFSGGGYYQPEMEDDGDELILGETMKCRHCRGSVVWTITIPEKTEVRFETASGSLDVTGTSSRIEARIASGGVTLIDCKGPMDVETASGALKIRDFTGDLSAGTASGEIDIRACTGQIQVNTASGDIKALDMSGDLSISTASGTIRADNLRGNIVLSTASGDVRATGIKVEGKSTFNSASGNAVISLASSPTSNIEVGSASGDAVLRYRGNPVQGHFEFTALADHGDINAPFEFDIERGFRRHGEDWVRKAFTLGTGGPEITIKTGSGEATLEK